MSIDLGQIFREALKEANIDFTKPLPKNLIYLLIEGLRRMFMSGELRRIAEEIRETSGEETNEVYLILSALEEAGLDEASMLRALKYIIGYTDEKPILPE